MKKSIHEMDMGEKALVAMTQAVRKAQERQWRLGLGVWVWKGGKVVNLPPPPYLALPLRLEHQEESPFDVPGVKVDITRDEIVSIVREGRER